MLASADATNSAYLWVGIVVGLVMLLGGGGGAIALVRWLKKQGIRDSQLDRVIVAVLGDDDHPDTHPSLASRLDDQDKKLDAAVKATSSNGLNTNQVGDVAKRTENGVKELTRTVEQHIGEEREARRTLWRAINGKADKA